MLKGVLVLLVICIAVKPINAQLVLVIDAMPKIEKSESIYVAGTFNNWNPNDSIFRLSKNKNGKYTVTVKGIGTIEYKFTKGSWSTTEAKLNGQQLPNRKYQFRNMKDTLPIKIEKWGDEIKSSRTSNVFVLDSAMLIPQLQRNRRIWIYLPNDYATSNRSYPVMYMQDGQNIFDTGTSYAGEWFVDGALSALQQKGDSGVIVVGIDNGGELRLKEFCPFTNKRNGEGQGDAFAEFIVSTLKPRIDSTFRTKPDRNNTAIGGSSLGAYFSLYAGIKYQDVFSKIASLSPAYWFDDSLYAYIINTGIQQPMRIYQVCSQNESASTVYNMWRMRDSLVDAGMFANQIQTVVCNYGAHNEKFWQKEFPIGYSWLYSNDVGKFIANFTENKSVTVTLNVANTSLKINYNFTPNVLAGFRIFDEQFQELNLNTSDFNQTEKQITINTTYFREGNYLLWLYDSKGKLYVRKFIKK